MEQAHILFMDPESQHLVDHEGMRMRVKAGVPEELFTPVCSHCEKANVEKRTNRTFYCRNCKLDVILAAA